MTSPDHLFYLKSKGQKVKRSNVKVAGWVCILLSASPLVVVIFIGSMRRLSWLSVSFDWLLSLLFIRNEGPIAVSVYRAAAHSDLNAKSTSAGVYYQPIVPVPRGLSFCVWRISWRRLVLSLAESTRQRKRQLLALKIPRGNELLCHGNDLISPYQELVTRYHELLPRSHDLFFLRAKIVCGNEIVTRNSW